MYMYEILFMIKHCTLFAKEWLYLDDMYNTGTLHARVLFHYVLDISRSTVIVSFIIS